METYIGIEEPFDGGDRINTVRDQLQEALGSEVRVDYVGDGNSGEGVFRITGDEAVPYDTAMRAVESNKLKTTGFFRVIEKSRSDAHGLKMALAA